MRKIIGAVFLSLDGVMQAPGGPNEDPTGGFEFGGWMAPFADEKTGKKVMSLFDHDFDLLLGRKTYEIFAAHWPYVSPTDAIGIPINKAAKYVVTRGNDPLEWKNSHRIKDIEAIKKLKDTSGPDLIIQGSSTLYPQLFAANLVDELRVMIFPLVLGKGKKLFGGGTPPGTMKLESSDVSGTGVIMATYKPAGKVQPGSFPVPEPTPEAELKRREKWKHES